MPAVYLPTSIATHPRRAFPWKTALLWAAWLALLLSPIAVIAHHESQQAELNRSQLEDLRRADQSRHEVQEGLAHLHEEK